MPSLPAHDHLRYWFISTSIIGATVSPYLVNFYFSGCVEEKMTENELWVDRVTSYAGTCFGGVVSMGILITAAGVLQPLGIKVDSFDQAALEIALNSGYLVAQAGGWHWGASQPRREAPRFVIAFTIVLLLATMLALSGIDPLQLTMISVALTVIVMPLVVLPFLVLMNDPKYVKEHTNWKIGNAVLLILTLASAAMAIVIVPLEMLGG